MGHLKHIKGKVDISHIAYLPFALLLHLTKCLMPFRTAQGTPLPFDKGNKRLVTIVHWRWYATEDAVKCSQQFSYQLSGGVQDQSFKLM